MIKFIDKVSRINSLGGIVQITTKEGSKYSGLMVSALIKRNLNKVKITLIGGESEKDPTILSIPIKDHDSVKIFKFRDLIEENMDNQFIPIDENGKLTLSPKKIKRIKKLNYQELEQKLIKMGKL
ncbi:MAG: hypothetical protein WD095_00715 [Candidatus Paceibacterota bacterium]